MKKLLLALVALSSVNAFSADAPAPAPAPVFQVAGNQFAGLSLGVAKPVGSNLSTPLRFSYGVEYAYALRNDFSVGVFSQRHSGDVSHNSDLDLTITTVGLNLRYNALYDLYVDLRGGIGFLDSSFKIGNTTVTVSSDENPWFIAPGFGYTFPVADRITLSPNLHYTHFFKTDDTTHFNVFDVAMTARFQF